MWYLQDGISRDTDLRISSCAGCPWEGKRGLMPRTRTHTQTLVPSAMRPGCVATLLQAIVAPLSVSSFRNDIARAGPAAAADAAAANDP